MYIFKLDDVRKHLSEEDRLTLKRLKIKLKWKMEREDASFTKIFRKYKETAKAADMLALEKNEGYYMPPKLEWCQTCKKIHNEDIVCDRYTKNPCMEIPPPRTKGETT